MLVGHVTPPPAREPLLRVIEVTDGDVEFSLPDADHTFHLPPISTLIGDMSIHCNPTPTWRPGDDQETLFSVAPEHRTIVVTLRATPNDIEHSDSCAIAVLFRDLMSLLGPRRSSAPKAHPWETWRGKTRLLYPLAAHGYSDNLSVYGTRVISAPLPLSTAIEIIDFNPHTVRRLLSAEAEEGPECGETLTEGQGDVNNRMTAAHRGDGRAVLTSNPGPIHDQRMNRARIVTDAPRQFPDWIPTDTMADCDLPYTSYEVPTPPDMNMNSCNNVGMGQDVIVFICVRGAHRITCRSMLILTSRRRRG